MKDHVRDALEAELAKLSLQTGGDAVDRNQYDGWVAAFIPGRREAVGFVDWRSWREWDGDKPVTKYDIKMIEVAPEYRRKGIASRLMQKFLADQGIALDDLGPVYRTEDGTAFREAFKKRGT